MKKIKKWILGIFVVSLAVVAPREASANFADWFSECALGKRLSLAIDIIVVGAGPAIGFAASGNSLDVSGLADCDGDPQLLDVQFREVRPRWSSGGSTSTSGKLVVDMQRRYTFDTDNNGVPNVVTGYGDIWRWKKTSTGEYYKARYTLSSDNKNGSLTMAMAGSALANTGSQTPASHTAPGVVSPTGYVYLQRVYLGTDSKSRYAPWIAVPNSPSILVWFVEKKVSARSVMKNAAGSVTTVKVAMGTVLARSVPKDGDFTQHIVYRRP